jgi:archaellum component FlaC
MTQPKFSAPAGFLPPGEEREIYARSGGYSPMDNFYRSVIHDTWMGEAYLSSRTMAETIEQVGEFQNDLTYNPFLDPDNKGYEDFVPESNSPQESAYIRKMVDTNTTLRRELDVGGAGVSRFLSQFVDPLTYTPIPYAKGLTFIPAAKKAFAPSLASISASELARAEFDPTVTGEETAINIATGTILSSTLAGGIGHYFTRRADASFAEIVNRAEKFGRKDTGTPNRGFQTEKGSTYIIDEQGRTIRTKVSEGAGQGTTFEPHHALYVSPEDSRSILDDMVGGGKSIRLGYMDNGKFVNVGNNKVPDGFDPVVGVFDKKTGQTVGIYKAVSNAEIGLSPVEKLYKDNGMASVHVGNKIVKLDNVFESGVDVPRNLADAKSAAENRLAQRQESISKLKEQSAKRRAEAAEKRAKASQAKSKSWTTRLNKEADALDAEAAKIDEKLPSVENTLRGLQDDVDSVNQKIYDIETEASADALALKATGLGLEKIRISEMPWYRLINTKLRQLSPRLAGQWMKLAYDIAGTPGMINEGARQGIAPGVSVEMLAKQWSNQYRVATESTNKAYMKYIGSGEPTRGQVIVEKGRQFVGGKLPEGKMKFDDFRKEVGRALMNNDTTSDPFVEEAVKAWRTMFDAFDKAAKETGVFQSIRQAQKNVDYWTARVKEAKKPKDIEYAAGRLDDAEEALAVLKSVEGRGQAKYFHRMWRLSEIEKRPEEFAELLRKHFRQNPKTIVNGKEVELSTKPADIEARVQETLAAIRKEAIFNDTMGLMNKGDRVERAKARVEQLKKDIEQRGDAKFIDDLTVREVREAQIRNLEAEIAKGKGDGVGGPSPILTRKLDINDYEFREFLEQDVDVVGQHYSMRMGPIIEMARKFGDFRMESKLDELNKLLDEEIAANPAMASKLEKERIALNKAVGDLRDKVLGVYGIPANPDALGVRALRALKAWNVLSLMGKAWLAALADAGRISMSEGFGRTFGNLFRNATDRLEKGKSSEWYKAGLEVEQAGEALEIAMATRMQQMTDIGGGYHGMTKLEKWIHQQQGPFFFLNMLSVWTDNAKRFAGGMIQSRMIEDALAWSAGKLPTERMERLAAVGMDEQWAKRFARQWREAGSSKGDSLYLANTEEWSDQEAVRVFRGIMSTEINNAVITPGAADKFNFMSKPLGSVLMQYRSFGLSATQRIMMSAMQQRDKSALLGITSMIALAGMVDYIRRPDWVELDADEMIFRAVERSGVTGIFSDINSALEIGSGMQFGLRPMLGLDAVVKDPNWAQRVGAPLGAVGSQWLQFIYAFTDSSATASEKAAGVRYMIPYQNLWFWSDAWTRAQRTLAEQLED